MGRKPDIPRYGDCKPVRSRRLAGRAPSKMVNSTTASRIPKSHHRGWSTHLASRRYRLAQPNRTQNSGFATPGGIGTHGIHPPRKRTSSNVKAHTANQNRYTRADTAVRPYAEDLFQSRSIIKAGSNTKQSFCNARRHRHTRDTSTAQADIQ